MRVTTQPAAHILILDDDPSIREGLALGLRGTYVVHGAATGDEARALLRRQPIAAIILDAVLHGEHGLDLIEPFRKLSRAPVLMLTGHSTEDLAIRALEAKVSHYLRKPVDLEKLQATLARILDHAGLPDDPVARARRLLDEHPEQSHTTASLANDVGLSERHLRRRFQRASGKTPRRYLTEVRMQQAANLLRMTPDGIEQIAFAIGYSSPAAFARLFKRAFGVTPSEFRACALLPGGREADGPGFPPT